MASYPCFAAYCSRLFWIDLRYAELYCLLSRTVKITTGGFPDGTCSRYGVSPRDPKRSHRHPIAPRRSSTSVLGRARRRNGGSCVALGRKGGGFEFLRGGYANCILSERTDAIRSVVG